MRSGRIVVAVLAVGTVVILLRPHLVRGSYEANGSAPAVASVSVPSAPGVLLPENNAEPEAALRALLESQAEAWNRGDIEGFMGGYWKSERTTFVGSSGIFRGWQALLDRYRRSYPNREAMGQLNFSELEITLLASDAAYIVGHWQLKRDKDRPGGVFTLITRRFAEGWRIVHDHTSQMAPAAGISTGRSESIAAQHYSAKAYKDQGGAQEPASRHYPE